MTANAAALELAERQPTIEEISHDIKAANLQALVRTVHRYAKARSAFKREGSDESAEAVERARSLMFSIARSLEDKPAELAQAVLQ